MALTKQKKHLKVATLAADIQNSTSAIVGTFTGLNATKDIALRKAVRDAGGSYHVVKNKLAPPFRQVEFDIMYGEGISKVGELIDLGVKAGVVEKSGSWFSYDSTRIGQGRENAKQFLRDHKDMALAIEKKVRDQAGVVANTMMSSVEEGEEAEAAE